MALTFTINNMPEFSKYKELITLTSSQSWSPDRDMAADVVVIGAGGSGAAQSQSAVDRPTGGAAGGFCKSSDVTLLQATSYTAVVGAGGEEVNAASGAASVGNNGGTTSFTDSGSLNLISNGGEGGVRIPSLSVTLANGGTASGGDINLTGGDSGGNTSNPSFTNGGANVDVGFGKNRSTVLPYEVYSSSGRGILGDTKATAILFGFSGLTTGHGAAFIPNLDFLGVITNPDPLPIAFRSRDGDISITTTPDIGVGGAGIFSSNSTGVLYAQNGGMFAGGGSAHIDSSSSGGQCSAGNGGIGGGGGYALGDSSGHSVRSGRGGDGIIFIAVKEYL